MQKNTMKINNRIFKNCKDMSATCFYVYICIKVYQANTNSDNFSIYDIKDNVGLAKSTLIRNIKELMPFGYIKERKTYNSFSNPYKTYSIVEPKDTIHGFTDFNLNFVEKIIYLVKEDKLNKRHLQIFLYLKYKELLRNNSWNLSQSHISRCLGVTRNAINISLKNLDKEIVKELYEIYGLEFEYIYDFLK